MQFLQNEQNRDEAIQLGLIDGEPVVEPIVSAVETPKPDAYSLGSTVTLLDVTVLGDTKTTNLTTECNVMSLYRKPMNKNAAAKKFRRGVSKTKALNMRNAPQRGGFRL